MNTTELSIIIPTHGSGDLTALLDSIEAQAESPAYEVLVVSNLPDPRLKNQLQRRGPSFKYLETGKIGVNLARNRGIDEARGEILLFLDDDCRLTRENFLRLHFSAHEKSPSIDAIGGPYELARPSNRWDKIYHRVQARFLASGDRLSATMDPLLGGNVSFKRKTLDAHRFDPELIYGGTETELFARLACAGASARLLPLLALEHRAQLTLGSLIRKAFLQGRGSARIATQQNPRWLTGSSHLAQPSRIFNLAFQAGYRSFPSERKSWPWIAFYLIKDSISEAIRVFRLRIIRDWATPLQASEIAAEKTRSARRSPPMNN